MMFCLIDACHASFFDCRVLTCLLLFISAPQPAQSSRHDELCRRRQDGVLDGDRRLSNLLELSEGRSTSSSTVHPLQPVCRTTVISLLVRLKILSHGTHTRPVTMSPAVLAGIATVCRSSTRSTKLGIESSDDVQRWASTSITKSAVASLPATVANGKRLSRVSVDGLISRTTIRPWNRGTWRVFSSVQATWRRSRCTDSSYALLHRLRHLVQLRSQPELQRRIGPRCDRFISLEEDPNVSMLAWTTTMDSSSNLALCVSPVDLREVERHCI